MSDCDEGDVDYVGGGSPYDGHDKCREERDALRAEVELLKGVIDVHKQREVSAAERFDRMVAERETLTKERDEMRVSRDGWVAACAKYAGIIEDRDRLRAVLVAIVEAWDRRHEEHVLVGYPGRQDPPDVCELIEAAHEVLDGKHD